MWPCAPAPCVGVHRGVCAEGRVEVLFCFLSPRSALGTTENILGMWQFRPLVGL